MFGDDILGKNELCFRFEVKIECKIGSGEIVVDSIGKN